MLITRKRKTKKMEVCIPFFLCLTKTKDEKRKWKLEFRFPMLWGTKNKNRNSNSVLQYRGKTEKNGSSNSAFRGRGKTETEKRSLNSVFLCCRKRVSLEYTQSAACIFTFWMKTVPKIKPKHLYSHT